ncbi:MAG: hypothetical protein KGR46_02905 [Verrucomicrobia bacterium]|nr:hypothetical protein [Verrucomicrobiota bacterium]
MKFVAKTLAALMGFLMLLAPANALEPIVFEVGSFSFQRPSDWKWIVPSSSMRKAQLDFEGAGGGKAETTFFHFGAGQGGGIEANVQRWFSQFQNSETGRIEEVVGITRVVFVTAKGTFLSGMPGTTPVPLENHSLRGAILEDATGGDVFVKTTGPTEVVEAASPAFDKMVRDAALGSAAQDAR